MSTETPTATTVASKASQRKVSNTVLVVGEARALKAAYQQSLEDTGVEANWVEDVGEALAEICRSPPLAVLTHFHLPGLPATSLIAALQASPKHRAIPVGLVTSNLMESEEAVGEWRPDRFVLKDSELVANLQEFFDATGILKKDENARVTLNGRILLAEDATTVQRLVGAILHVAGAEVVTVSNGLDAIMAASQESFDLILMDLEMPKMDGKVATKAIRSMGIEAPIIAFTGHDSMEFRHEANALGFSGVLGKVLSRGPFVAALAAFMDGTSEELSE